MMVRVVLSTSVPNSTCPFFTHNKIAFPVAWNKPPFYFFGSFINADGVLNGNPFISATGTLPRYFLFCLSSEINSFFSSVLLCLSTFQNIFIKLHINCHYWKLGWQCFFFNFNKPIFFIKSLCCNKFFCRSQKYYIIFFLSCPFKKVIQ